MTDAAPCSKGAHEWSNQFGDDWTPDVGMLCDCRQKRWGIPPSDAGDRHQPRTVDASDPQFTDVECGCGYRHVADQLRAEIDTLRGTRQSHREEIAALRASLKTAHEERDKAKEFGVLIQRSLDAAEGHWRDTKELLEITEAQLKTAEQERQQIQTDLALSHDERRNLTTEYDRLKAQKDSILAREQSAIDARITEAVQVELERAEKAESQLSTLLVARDRLIAEMREADKAPLGSGIISSTEWAERFSTLGEQAQ